MSLSRTFIDRPIFATVLSAFVTLAGLGALAILPVAQYPEIVPPTVQITTSYPGASAETVSRTVATPLEQQINGVENMLYMSSQSTGDGNLTVTVTFRIGTDLNVAQMLTQNRVQDALPRLPEDVQRLGVQVRKSTPNILLAVHLYSPDSSRDTLYLSKLCDAAREGRVCAVARGRRRAVPGRAANTRCESGSIRTRSPRATSTPPRCWRRFGRRTCRFPPAFSISRRSPPLRPTRSTSRRSDGWATPEQFGEIVLKSDPQGPRDPVARRRTRRSRRRGLRIDGFHGSRAGDSAVDLRPARRQFAGGRERSAEERRRRLQRIFLPASPYKVIYDPTIFVAKSVHEVITTILHRHPAGGGRGVSVPAKLARRHHSRDRDPGVADRDLRHPLCARNLPQQPVRCSGWCSRSASWSTTPSWWCENVERNLERGMQPAEAAGASPWTRSAAR